MSTFLKNTRMTTISIQSDGKDYSNVDFGEHVGHIAPAIAIGAGIIVVYIAGIYAVQQNGKTIGTYTDLKTAQKNAQYLLNKAGDGLKWIWNGGAWIVKKISNVYKAEHTKISEDKNTKNKHEKGKARKQRDQGGEKKKKKKGWIQRGGKKK